MLAGISDSSDKLLVIADTGAIPRSSDRVCALSQPEVGGRRFPNTFFTTSHKYNYRRTSSDPGVAERLKRGGSSVSVRSRLKQGVPLWEANNAPGER